MQTITVGPRQYSLVTMPSSPGAAAIELGWNDLISVEESPYTKQQQTLQWPGADWWDAKLTLPPMTAATSAAWEGFLAGLRGPLNVFQLGDPRRTSPLGEIGESVPVCDNTGSNVATVTTLGTTGWRPNAARLLLPGDLFQIGYRLHRVCEMVSSSGSGAAQITIWPSLREAPAAGTPLIFNAPKGLFRLAGGRQLLHASPRQATAIGTINCVEVR